MFVNPVFTNPVKERLKAGEPVLNGWLHIPSSLTAEAMAHAGFDTLTLDLQHGPYGLEAVLLMLQAISGTATVPLARVPWNEPGVVMKLLDMGCYGLICPMVSTRAECEAFVGACRYPPAGYRSFGPTRVRLGVDDSYAARANGEILTFAMIETAEALENLDDIMSVPGLGGVYVGPADLSQALGGPPGADWDEGPVVEALSHILEAAQKHGLVAGIHTMSAAYAKRMVGLGYRFVTVQSDLNFLLSGAKATVAAFGETAPATPAAY